MKILFIHQNFPGQFKNLAPHLAGRGHEVIALTLTGKNRINWNGVSIIPYNLNRGNTKGIHPWVVDFESKVIRGEGCLEAAIRLKDSGFSPDIIIGHPGWGECLFLKEIWPAARLKLYFEYFYNTENFDVGFDPEFKKDNIKDNSRVILKNTVTLLQTNIADSILCPTNWQKSSFPRFIQEKIDVIHEGVDTKIIDHDPSASFKLDSGKLLKTTDKVLTYINRSLEPYRGIHIFLRSLKKILKKDNEIEIVIVGEESSGYGSLPLSGKTWKQIFCDEIYPDLTPNEISRINFVGRLAYTDYLKVLSVSSIHVYLTYPFVLSWSLLEAMSARCAIIASDTDPVREVISDNKNGKLVNFFDIDALSNEVLELIGDKERRAAYGAAARETVVSNYDLENICLPRHVHWACND